MNPTICLVNRSRTVGDSDVKFVLPALQKQITRHFEFLQKHLLGNPHSTNPSSSVASVQGADLVTGVVRRFTVGDDDLETVGVVILVE